MKAFYKRKYSVVNWATWLVIGCSLLASPTLRASERVYSFSVVPQQSATKLARTWVPLLQLLKVKTGVSLRFVTAPDIPIFESRLAAGEYDFAYMNPYHYTVYHQNPGYQAFAKQADKQIRGILVARQDSAYQAVEELEGQAIAFPAPAAFAATLLVRSYLNSRGVSYDPKFVSSHDSVYRAVAGKFAVAGGGIVRTLESVDPEVRAQLRVLWKSPGYTPHAFAAHPRVPASVVKQVQQALGELINYPEGIDVLKKINFKAIEKAGDSDWEDIRNLNIDAIKSVN
jgi:phosphonate transport system substrate-binding protein